MKITIGRTRMLALLVLGTAGVAATFSLGMSPEAGPADGGRRGREVLEQSAAAYVAAPGLVDVGRLEITMAGRPPQKVDVEYAFGAKSDGYVKLPGLTATAVDGRLYVTRDDVPDKYLEVALQGDLASTMDAILQAESNLPAQFDMRAGRPVEEYLPAISLGVLQDARIVDHEMTTLENGAAAHRIGIVGSNGESHLWIDVESRLLRRMTLEASMPGPQPVALTANAEYDPKISISPGRLVAFDPKERKSVGSYESLQPTRIGAGAMAPDFALKTLDGQTVRLSDLRGSVVVLDFWATWCGPCRMGLPLLQKFEDWVQENERPVAVFAIDTFERASTADKMREAAAAFWDKQGFTMPTLLDDENGTAIAYGVSGIPITYVIDREGRVDKVHQGFDPRMTQTLKRDVEELLR